MEDGRGRLGLAGRRQLVRLIQEGSSLRAAARRLGVAPATAHRWWQRWDQADERSRTSLECLRSRPPTPRTCPWALSDDEQQRILDARARTNLGPARLAGLVGRRRSTIWKVLHRHGVSRRRRSPRPERPTRRYEWAEPGALLHIDTKQLARFDRPRPLRPRRPRRTPPQPRRRLPLRPLRSRRPQPPRLRRAAPRPAWRDLRRLPCAGRRLHGRGGLRPHPGRHE